MKKYNRRITFRQKQILATYIQEFEKNGVAPSWTTVAKILNTTKCNVYNISRRALRNIQNCPLCGQKMPL